MSENRTQSAAGSTASAHAAPSFVPSSSTPSSTSSSTPSLPSLPSFRERVRSLYHHHHPERRTPHGALIWFVRQVPGYKDGYDTPSRWARGAHSPPALVMAFLEQMEREAYGMDGREKREKRGAKRAAKGTANESRKGGAGKGGQRQKRGV